MATYYTPQYEKLRNNQALDTNEWGGRVRVAYATMTLSAADGDKVYMAQIPARSRVVGGRLAFEALGSGTALALGFNGNDVLGTYSTENMDSKPIAASVSEAGAVAPTDHAMVDITLTVTGDAAGAVTMTLFYVLD